MTLEKDGYTLYEYKHGIDRVLSDLANVFCLSERPLKEHARAGRILGVNFNLDDYKWEFSSNPGFEGPVPDRPQEYLLPPGKLRGVFPQLVSGVVSCQLFVGTITTTELKEKNLVEFYGMLSGANCRPVVDHYQKYTEEGG